MSEDERWYEAVKLMKKAAELLEVKLIEVRHLHSTGLEEKSLTVKFPIKQPKQ
jgi:hypothetical protein